MLREYEIFSQATGGLVAVKRGFCWPGFFLPFLWTLLRRLWVPGSLVLGACLLLAALKGTVWADEHVLSILLSLVLQLTVGFRGNSWRSRKLERQGSRFAGVVVARSAATAVAAHLSGRSETSPSSPRLARFIPIPGWIQGLLAIAGLTWKAAFRFRLFLVMAVLLLAAVVGLPILIKDDGTARGFTQILMTYTLSVITVLLGLSTLWLSCGTLARDIEECQIQVVAVKPVARWQIWLGKWLGIMSLNAALLALSGASVYGLVQWRATRLPPAEQAILRNEVLVARGSAREKSPDDEIDAEAGRILEDRVKKNPALKLQANLSEVRRQIREQVKNEYELVPPGYSRLWQIDLGSKRQALHGRPLQLRVKFNAADKSPSGTFAALWQAGVPQKTPNLWRNEVPMSLASETFHEFEIPADLFDDKGVLSIVFVNPNKTALLFPLDEGMEVLYREGGFGMNYVRGLGIIFCWMALLAALGLASASLLSFPVAAFVSLSLLAIALSSGVLSNVVSQGSLTGSNTPSGPVGQGLFNYIVAPVFGTILKVVNLARDFSPIDSLSSGRMISWSQLALAFVQIVLLLGGVIALTGIGIFSRRELATAQGNQ